MVRLASFLAAASLLAAPLAHAGGSVAGRVAFDGAAPEPKTLRVSSDPNCAKAHPEGLKDDHLVVTGGAVRDVVVFVSAGLPKDYAPPPAPAEAVTLDQKGCMYRPKVVALRVGQPLHVLNSDPTFHNVHGRRGNSSEFNVGMVGGDPTKFVERRFDRPELGFRFQCDVHPWMAAYAAAFDHPFFAVTGADGRYVLAGLPAGTYTVEAWHATLGLVKRERVAVADGETTTVDLAMRR